MELASITRYEGNPILKPKGDAPWESYAVFNGSVVEHEGKTAMVYRAMGDEVEVMGNRLRLSQVGFAESADGINFPERRLLIKPENDWESYGIEDPRVTFLDGEYYIFYTALSLFPFRGEGTKVGMATTRDFVNINEKRLITPFNSKAMALFPRKINDKYTVIFTVDPERLPAKVAIASFSKWEEVENREWWEEWYSHLTDNIVPLRRMNHDHVEVGAVPVEMPEGWLLIYCYIKNYMAGAPEFRIEMTLLDKNDPRKIIGRGSLPLLEPELSYEKEGQVKDIVFPSGALIKDDVLRIYYGGADSTVNLATMPMSALRKAMIKHAFGLPKLTRKEKPILVPDPAHAWEAKAVFNPAAVYDGGAVHLIYRAMSFDNTSVFGHAATKDGFTIDERLSEPVYLPKNESEYKKKPFANSGCEDPRVTRINDRFYMLYTSYNGADQPRVSLTSILVDDFLNHRWNWKEPVAISKPGVDDKDACLLPEQIDGRYVIFHRIGRNIVFDFADTLDLDGNTFFEGSNQIFIREKLWDSVRIGIAAPPIKTKQGWLLLYHGISQIDHEYRVGAMLLDLHHPTIVLARANYPILEPEMDWERNGQTNNVVFPCGVVLVDETLFVYYGGADKVIGVATMPMNVLMTYLEEERKPESL